MDATGSKHASNACHTQIYKNTYMTNKQTNMDTFTENTRHHHHQYHQYHHRNIPFNSLKQYISITSKIVTHIHRSDPPTQTIAFIELPFSPIPMQIPMQIHMQIHFQKNPIHSLTSSATSK